LSKPRSGLLLHQEQNPIEFCSCKGRTIVSGALPIHFALHFGLWKAERTALGGPFVSALAVCRDEKILCCV
jgi:hypothetical protein